MCPAMILLKVICILVMSIIRVRADGNMYKVGFFQIDQDQFLVYPMTNRKLTDVVTCMWYKPLNLSTPQTLYSYSDEELTLMKLWIVPGDPRLKLRIWNKIEFDQPIGENLVVGRWCHLCVEWSTARARWTLYFNGKLFNSGKLKQVFPLGHSGHLTLGHDLALIDSEHHVGLQGWVFGFNLLDSSPSFHPVMTEARFKRHSFHPEAFNHTTLDRRRRHLFLKHYFRKWLSRFKSSPSTSLIPPPSSRNEFIHKSFRRCAENEGTPTVSEPERILIQWTKTPVKVYGGVLFSNANSECGHF